jgi:Skp family chaperone for outer membrane proteins
MKKVLMAAIAILGMVLAGSQEASAQQKFGYFDLEYVLSVMPGVEKVDSMMQSFERDSLNSEYQFELAELQRMDSTLKADSAKMPARLYQQRQQEQAQRFFKLQNWQQYSQQVMQAKQQELLGPFYQKILEAFRQVKDEGKYTYIFKSESLYDAPQADNLVPLVAKKLNIKLPTAPGGAAPGNSPGAQKKN